MQVKEYIEYLQALPQDYECVSLYDSTPVETKKPHLPNDYERYWLEDYVDTQRVVVISDL